MKKFFITLFLLPALFAEGSHTKPYYDVVGDQALAKVNYDWKKLIRDWKINFYPVDPTNSGMAKRDKHCIDICISQKVSSSRVAEVIVHELAHYVDWTFFTKAQRAEWYRLRGIPQSVMWYPPIKGADYGFGIGDFAECMAWTLQGPATKFRSLLGPPPTPEQQQTIRKWLAEINTAGK